MRVESREEEKQHRLAMRQLAVAESDEKAMAKYREDHPDEVLVELEFYARRDEERKKERAEKKKRKAEMEAQLDEVGLSTVYSDDGRWLDLFITSSSDEE